MNTEPQFIRNKNGDPAYVVLPVAEYEALVSALEDAEDIAAADAAQAARTRGEELVPGKVVSRLLAGDNPVRVWRNHRGLRQRDLAQAAKIGQSYLSQIELGAREGTLETMAKLARALGVDLDDLVPALQDED
ncbi:MAG TPA: helix-turn-helix transcriptional regulator [Alphaproteobacteria bacterium]|jgi:ribosome-binding protein aMBF1 (putative translation factor)|nr:helix-turn-helix transcriptional regulator [Alphaproteobacteria bacterium]MDP6270571.1 helix-turn-helix transcriptional regulator [Alphaproteobacteria bacterium]MDP7428201.1 helix-turn-helix transcriptional regulator [Alphaproteobacteria bacterium]HJM50334.1 helix-turn-helix transcriptional regulator [Alphaproteobacteria bacterium]|tara:strand:+ start:1592 stop:1990 length:399 start_codon:yes stop_codon:yes gene_type:complete